MFRKASLYLLGIFALASAAFADDGDSGIVGHYHGTLGPPCAASLLPESTADITSRCAPLPGGSGSIDVMTPDGLQVAYSFGVDPSGSFKVLLPPAKYLLRPQWIINRHLLIAILSNPTVMQEIPERVTGPIKLVTVEAHAFTPFDFDFGNVPLPVITSTPSNANGSGPTVKSNAPLPINPGITSNTSTGPVAKSTGPRPALR